MTEIFKMLGYDLTFIAQKIANFEGFKWEIFPNFGLCENSKINETFFKSDILQIYGFCLTFSHLKV